MPRNHIAETTTLLMLRLAGDHSVAVITFDEYDHQVARGSGVCIQIEGRYFIATAAHLVREAKLKEIGILSSWVPTDKTPRLLGFGHRGGRKADPMGGRKGDPMDIAWLEVDPGAATTMGREFASLNLVEVGPLPPPPAKVLVYGCPGVRIQETVRDGRELTQVSPIGYLTQTASTVDPWFQPDPRFDIFLEYPDNVNEDAPHGWLKTVPDAPGLSGAGLWMLNMRDKELWTPDAAKIVGIQHSWSGSDRLLRGTVMRHWLEMVRDDIPELAITINALLAAP